MLEDILYSKRVVTLVWFNSRNKLRVQFFFRQGNSRLLHTYRRLCMCTRVCVQSVSSWTHDIRVRSHYRNVIRISCPSYKSFGNRSTLIVGNDHFSSLLLVRDTSVGGERDGLLNSWSLFRSITRFSHTPRVNLTPVSFATAQQGIFRVQIMEQCLVEWDGVPRYWSRADWSSNYQGQ